MSVLRLSRRVVPHVFVIGILLALGCQSSKPAGEPSAPEAANYESKTWNVRGKLAQGTRTIERMKLTINDGKLTITHPQASLQAIVDSTMVFREEMHVVEAKDGEPTRLRIIHIEDVTTSTTQIAGTSKTETQKGELDGREEVAVLEAGVWRRTLVGEAATTAQQKQLDTPPLSRDDLPTSAKIGDTWDLKGATLRRYLGAGDVLGLEGGITEKLVSVEKKAGEELATIISGGSFNARVLDDDNEEVLMEMSLDLTTIRSLTKGYDLSSSGKGTITVSTPEERLGPSIRMVARLTLEVTTEPAATVAAQ